MIKALTVIAAIAFLTAPASALTYCPKDQTYRATCPNQPAATHATRVSARAYSSDATIVGGRPSGCPYAYCGCGTSLKVFGRIIPALNVAGAWGRFPSASPAAGMVAYNSRHVFYIQSANGDGTVVAYDSNSGGHKTRVHTVSLRGYRVVNPNGSRYAAR